MDEYVAILKWAAGITSQIPNDLEFDTARLLAIVDAHNLSGRFLGRIHERDVRWVTSELVDGLEQLHIETKRQVFRNITALGELQRYLAGARTIIIKGISTYVLSPEEETMRAGDIDLLSNKPDQVVQTLLDMGYVQTRAPFMHEIGEYTRDGIEFDIHDHFPVYRYPQALLESDPNPLNHPGTWEQSYRSEHTTVTFDDLERSAHRGKRQETSHVTVPDPNLLALIICAHAFMNYTNVWSISHREKACVRLSEIADLFSLAAHPSFNSAQFLDYVNHYCALDAVEWATSVAVSLFGKKPLPVSVLVAQGEPLPSSRFPRCLWWNFWASLPTEADDLLRKQWLSMDWLTEQTGANRFSVLEGQEARYTTTWKEDASPLMRRITQTSEPIPIQLCFKRSDQGIAVQLQVDTAYQANIERVRVDLGNIASEWICTADGDRLNQVGYPFESDLVHFQSGYQLTCQLAWEALGMSYPSARTVALLIGVARQKGWNELVASTLIPLVISF